MKRLLKQIFLIIVLIISITTTTVIAKGGKTITIELPSQGIDNIWDYYSQLTIRQFVAIQTLGSLLEFDSDLIFNQNGKPIIRYNESGPIYYELLEGVTEEDCIFDIPNEMLTAMDYNFPNIFEGYDKIKLEVKEIEHKAIDDEIYIIDISNNNP